jgi:hypothetical protein
MDIQLELERRALDRRRVFLSGTLRVAGRPARSVKILDLSTGGCALEPGGSLKTHQLIWVRLPGLESWESSVAWMKDSRVGVQFKRPLHPAVLANLILS